MFTDEVNIKIEPEILSTESTSKDASEEFTERSSDFESTYQMTNNVNLSRKRMRSTSSLYVDSMVPNSYNHMNKYPVKDECAAFGQYVESVLRKFDDKRRSFTIHQISKIIFDVEMRMYDAADCDQCGKRTNGDF